MPGKIVSGLAISNSGTAPTCKPWRRYSDLLVKILVCEDEFEVASFVRDALVSMGYSVDVADNGQLGLALLSARDYDAAILDIMLPKLNGLEVLKFARAHGVKTPILLLSAKFLVDDRIEGLDAGANDYLVKPFALGELLARVRVLTRQALDGGSTLSCLGLNLDPTTRRVTFAGRVVFLSPTEFSLLHLLMKNEGRVVSRAAILDHVWDDQGFRGSNVVEVYINYLRSKLDPQLIRTVRGRGYIFGEPEEA